MDLAIAHISATEVYSEWLTKFSRITMFYICIFIQKRITLLALTGYQLLAANACPQLSPTPAAKAEGGQRADSPMRGRLGDGGIGTQADHYRASENRAGSQEAAGRGMTRRQGQTWTWGKPGWQRLRGSAEQPVGGAGQRDRHRGEEAGEEEDEGARGFSPKCR